MGDYLASGCLVMHLKKQKKREKKCAYSDWYSLTLFSSHLKD